MICCLVLKIPHKSQTLLLDRKKQALLDDYLASFLRYKPFIFNSTMGTYIFVKKEESFKKIQNILFDFFNQSDLNHLKTYDTSLHPEFFLHEMQQILTSNEISALEWKHFISSFILQIDPFNTSTTANAISIFENFRNCINNKGTKHQKKYFRRRMKMMRKRVSLYGIEKLLDID